MARIAKELGDAEDELKAMDMQHVYAGAHGASVMSDSDVSGDGDSENSSSEHGYRDGGDAASDAGSEYSMVSSLSEGSEF